LRQVNRLSPERIFDFGLRIVDLNATLKISAAADLDVAMFMSHDANQACALHQRDSPSTFHLPPSTFHLSPSTKTTISYSLATGH